MTRDERNRILDMLILALYARLGRPPTEDELVEYINGDATTRQKIWDKSQNNSN